MMILVAAVMMKGGSLPERRTWSRRSRGSWREGTAERRRSFKFVQKLGLSLLKALHRQSGWRLVEMGLWEWKEERKQSNDWYMSQCRCHVCLALEKLKKPVQTIITITIMISITNLRRSRYGRRVGSKPRLLATIRTKAGRT